jgi:nucleotide-binding universal stress UspA family protein
MYKIKKLMVAVDMTGHDKTLIEYSLFIGNLIKADVINFVHVQETVDEKDLAERMGLQFVSTDDFNAYIEGVFKEIDHKPEGIEIRKFLLTGASLHELLRFARDEDIDMVVLGEKCNYEGSGILSYRFSRKSPCSVLFVPRDVSYQIKKVLIPTDFSEYSAMAFDEANYFVKEFTDIHLIAQHVYHVPVGYYKTGKSYEEFSEIMKKNSMKMFDDFIEKYELQSLNLEAVYSLSDDHNPSLKINEVAMQKDVGLIIIGAKGHTRASVILLGSTTEKLLKLNCKTPLMILKQKGETISILDVLLNV